MEKYENLKMEVIVFENDDVIVTSDPNSIGTDIIPIVKEP